jgi:hypothetical protein
MTKIELEEILKVLPDGELVVYDPSVKSYLGSIELVTVIYDERHKEVIHLELCLEGRSRETSL